METTNNVNIILGFIDADINDDYRKIWHANEKDFIFITKNGIPINNTLYRIGGLNRPKLNHDKYFMLLKYVESYYSDNITNVKKDKPHLEGRWCILDKNGNEKVEFHRFDSPYLVDNSCIYINNSKYFNIETGEFYCSATSVMQSTDYLFLENRFDKEESKRGVMKINKENGKWELFH